MLKRLWQIVLGVCLGLIVLSIWSDVSNQLESCPSLKEIRESSPIANEEKLFPISQNGKWGFMNSAGQVVIEPQFDVVDRFSENRAPFGSRRNGKWGYIDTEGRVIVEPLYDNANPFFGGRGSVKNGGRVSFIDHDGREIAGRYAKVTGFYEGRAFGRGGDFQWRMFDLDGNLVTEDSFDAVGSFSEGLAAFSGRNSTDQSGFINREGNVAIELKNIHPGTDKYGFRGGLAPVFVRKPFYWYQFLNFTTWGDEMWGFINKKGQQVIPLQYDNVSDFSECLATVWMNDKAGVINRKGRLVVKPKFSSVSFFSEGLAVIQVGESWPVSQPDFDQGIFSAAKYGYIDKTGRIRVEPQFSMADEFHEGLAVVQMGDTGKKGYIDPRGAFVIEPKFDKAGPFQNGLAKVQVGQQWGYINYVGDFVWIGLNGGNHPPFQRFY